MDILQIYVGTLGISMTVCVLALITNHDKWAQRFLVVFVSLFGLGGVALILKGLQLS